MMRKNILLIGHSADMYGASRSLAKLAAIFHNEHQVHVVLPEKGPLYDKLLTILPKERLIIAPDYYIFTRKSFKLKFILPTSRRFLESVVTIRNLIRKHQIHIVHTNSGVAPAGALAAKLSGIKHIWHIREWFGDFKKFWPIYRAYMIRFSDKIICVSKTVASQFNNDPKVIAIYNGFDIPETLAPEALTPELTQKLESADLVIGCTSRIRLIRKGQEYLIKAIGMLSRKSGKNIQLVLIGDYVPGYESQKETIEALIRKFDLEQKVHFLGHQQNPLPFYPHFDLFVLPSGEPEPFGGVIMEAMSMGLAVIGSNEGGTTEQIAEDWNGYLFESRNPIDLADKIEVFINEPEKIELFGQRSKERIREMFSLEMHRAKILNEYKN